MRRRRICLIGPANNVHIHRWAQSLIERDFQVSLISTVPASTALPPALAHMPIYTIPTARPRMSPAVRFATLLQGWARVPGLIAALRPDLIHVHSLPTPAAVPFLRRVGPLIVSSWGSDVVQRDRRKTRFYPHLLTHAAAITATSHYLANVTASYLSTPRRIVVVPFGVDPARFHPSAVPPTERRIGTVRHLEVNYGIDVLLEALRLLGNPDLQVVIAGEGSLRPDLESYARQLGIAGQIRWLGRIEHAAVPDLLRSLSVFVMPSRAESFGVAALEAQACGVPVVATEVGGLPEVVRDGATGILVPPENPAMLAQAIKVLLADPDRRAMMHAVGPHWVAEHYTWEMSVEQMLYVYEGAAG